MSVVLRKYSFTLLEKKKTSFYPPASAGPPRPRDDASWLLPFPFRRFRGFLPFSIRRTSRRTSLYVLRTPARTSGEAPHATPRQNPATTLM